MVAGCNMPEGRTQFVLEWIQSTGFSFPFVNNAGSGIWPWWRFVFNNAACLKNMSVKFNIDETWPK